MNEFYWAIATQYNPVDENGEVGLGVKWLLKNGELEPTGINNPKVKLFDTESDAMDYRDAFLDPRKCFPQKIHRDYIYI
jgi:hypothetical protein